MTTDKSAAPATQPACCLCDDRPQAPNNPCGACGKTAPQPAIPDREALVEAILQGDLDDVLGKYGAGFIANILIARGLRLPTNAQSETLAWAIVEADGYIDTDLIYDNFDDVRGCIPGETVKRVAIRVVDDEADAGKGEVG